MQTVLDFAESFKDSLLIPLAREGLLNEETLREVAELYVEELEGPKRRRETVRIEFDGPLACLHPMFASKFSVEGREWDSVEHYYQAARYFKVNDRLAEEIRSAKTPQIAHRRGVNAQVGHAARRPDWNICAKTELETACKALLENSSEVRDALKSTKDDIIVLPHKTDSFLGCFEDGTGKNVLGEVWMKLRSE